MIDLHIHTNNSDGKMSPKELVQLYESKGFKLISFTDHDSIKAYEEIKNLKVPESIKVISGVELTLDENGYEFHILSYGFEIDEDKRKFLRLIKEKKRKGTINRIKRINEKLKLDGLNEVDGEELMLGKIPYSYQIANAIMKSNNISYDIAYKKFVVPIRSSLIRNLPSIKDAHQAGFQNLILAHPFSKYHSLEEYCNTQQKNLLESLKYLFSKGLTGIEVYSPRHSNDQISFLKRNVQGNYLLTTCGSDFHKPEDLERFMNNFSNYIKFKKNKYLVKCLEGLK